MRVRVIRGGSRAERKMVELNGTEVKEVVKEPIVWDVTYLWNYDKIWVDDDGLEFHLNTLLTPEQKEQLDYNYPEVGIVSGDQLQELYAEWPQYLDEEFDEYFDLEDYTVQLGGIPIHIKWTKDMVDEIYAAWKIHYMDWDEIEGIFNDFSEDIIDTVGGFRLEISENHNADVEHYEDVHFWLSREVHRLGDELVRRIRKCEEQWN